MKIKFVFVAVLIFGFSNLKSQQKKPDTNIPVIGQDAPRFYAESTAGTLSFPDDYGQNWKVIFSHPRDFTPVCTSEILQLARMQEDFANLETKLIVISTDFIQSHFQWKKELESLRTERFEPVKIKFPLVADDHFVIAKKYGMMHLNVSKTQTVRGVFYITPDNKIAAFSFYPMNIGRNLEDIKSTLIALQSAY